MRILFVCAGNICRSPTAEGVMRGLLDADGVTGVEVESAGTGGWHAGDPPDPRSVAAARARSIVVDGAARQVTAEDFDRFDLVLALDRENQRDLLARAPADARDRIRLLREFDPESVAAGELDVPDPYYGAERGFEEVLDVIERACAGLLEHVRAAAR